MNKKLITKTILILFMCASVFAKSNKKAEKKVAEEPVAIEVTESETNIEEADEIITIDESEVTEPVAPVSDSYDEDKDAADDYELPADAKAKNKKKGNFFKDFFTFGNKGQYIYPDEISLFSKPYMGPLKQYAASIIIEPETGAAGFGTKTQGKYYILLLDSKSRAALKKASEQYLNDFSNKKLNRNNKKSYKIYGKTPLKLRWGTFKTSTPNKAEGSFFLGYKFSDKSPYFIITVPELKNKFYDDTTTAPMGSERLEFYFTKAQISSLVEMLDENKISNEIYDFEIQEYGIPQDADAY